VRQAAHGDQRKRQQTDFIGRPAPVTGTTVEWHYIVQASKPMQNGSIESFTGRVRMNTSKTLRSRTNAVNHLKQSDTSDFSRCSLCIYFAINRIKPV